jgi:hypothetical protein
MLWQPALHLEKQPPPYISPTALPDTKSSSSSWGPHTTGVGCLYIKDVDKVDLSVLEAIVADSYRTVSTGTYGLR